MTESSWEGLPRAFWRMRWHVPELLVFSEIGSTSDVARERAAAGAPAGTLVLAKHQTAGRGRLGRTWIDAPGASLLASLVLRPRPTTVPAPGTAPLRIGLAVAGALRERFGIDAQLKWPNDVVVPGRGKLAGILCEAFSTGASVHIVAGIGINVQQQPRDWPPHLKAHATSLAIVTGGHPAPADVMDALAPRLQPLFQAPLARFGDVELEAFASFDALAGCVIDVATGAETITGTAAGIDPDGALLVDTDNGTRRVTAGTVRIATYPTRARDPA